MSENVEMYEAGPSSGASTPRHGASPSPGEMKTAPGVASRGVGGEYVNASAECGCAVS